MDKITAYRKNTKELPITIKLNKTPIDLTGYIVKFAVKKNLTDTDLNSKILKTNSTHSDAINGLTTFILSSSDLDITPDKYVFEILLYKEDLSYRRTILIGDFHVAEPVLK